MKRVLKLEEGKYLPSCHMCCCCGGAVSICCREGHGQPAVEGFQAMRSGSSRRPMTWRAVSCHKGNATQIHT